MSATWNYSDTDPPTAASSTLIARVATSVATIRAQLEREVYHPGNLLSEVHVCTDHGKPVIVVVCGIKLDNGTYCVGDPFEVAQALMDTDISNIITDTEKFKIVAHLDDTFGATSEYLDALCCEGALWGLSE